MESSLHRSLKEFYAKDTGVMEAALGGYKIDVLKDDTAIEIQTESLHVIKSKLKKLLEKHNVRLVVPLYAEKFIIRVNEQNAVVQIKKSPKKETIYCIFNKIIGISDILLSERFTLEVVMLRINEYRPAEGEIRHFRAKPTVFDRELAGIISSRIFRTVDDYIALFPEELRTNLTNKKIAAAFKVNKTIAGKTGWCLRKAGILTVTGKTGNELIYSF